MNRLKHGRHQPRAWLTLALINQLPPRAHAAIGRELHARGIIAVGRPPTPSDARRMHAYLIRKWFDSAPAVQSDSIKHNQTADLARAFDILREAHALEAAHTHRESTAAPLALPAPAPEKAENENTATQSKAAQ